MLGVLGAFFMGKNRGSFFSMFLKHFERGLETPNGFFLLLEESWGS